MGRKAQVTLFIIIGLILLSLTALFLFYRNIQPKTAGQRIVEQAPTEVEPVKNFVEECLRRVAVEGLVKSGQRAGYIDTLEFGLIADKQEPTKSKAVQFLPGIDVPYWYYLKDSNNCLDSGSAGSGQSCIFGSEKPPLHRPGAKSIESQLARYVEKNIGTCLQDFRQFNKQGFIIQSNYPIVIADVLEHSVEFKLNMPLNVTAQGRTTKLSNFYFEQELQLKRMYELAENIVRLEQAHSYLETSALNLIVAYSGLDGGRLPPMHESTFGQGNYKFFIYSEVKKTLQDILSTTMPLLQVQGALNYKAPSQTEPAVRALYNGMVLPAANVTVPHSDFSVSHLYIDYPIYFETGRKGELIEPEDFGVNLGFLFIGIQRYNIVYDLSYPVIISIHDPKAMDEKGFTFNFAMESNIRGNQPLQENESNEILGEDLTRDLSSSPIVFEQVNFNSGPVTINVIDGNTGKNVEGVSVLLEIGSDSTLIELTENKTLKTKLPSGFCGSLRFIKPGYLGSAEPLCISSPGQSLDIDKTLWPFKDVLIKVQKVKLVKGYGNCTVVVPGWAIDSSTEFPFYENETGIVTLTRIPDNTYGSIYDDILPVIAQLNASGEAHFPFGIVPGNYEVDIQLWNNQQLRIPADTRCQCIGWLFCSNECFTIPQLDFNETYPSGALIWTNSSPGLWIYPSRLYRADEIVFRVPSPAFLDIPDSSRKVEDLQLMGSLGNYSELCRTSFRQEFRAAGAIVR